MATPTHDATTTGAGTKFLNTTTPSFTHTRGVTCPDPYMLITLAWQDGTPGTLSGVTVNSNPATVISNPLRPSGQTQYNLATFEYLSPVSGSNTIVATFSEQVNGALFRVSTYMNVHQTVPRGAVTTVNNDTSSPVAISVASDVGDLVVDAFIAATLASSPTPDASQTQRYNEGFAGAILHGGSEKAGAATTTTMQWTWTTGDFTVLTGFALKPTVDPPSRPMFRGS
jgi:hypothetical protein